MARERKRGQPRGRTLLVEPVRPDVHRRGSRAARRTHAPLPPVALGPRWDVREDLRRDALPVARRRPRGRGAEELPDEATGSPGSVGFLKNAIRRHGSLEVIVTDRIRSHGVALKDLCLSDDREMGRWVSKRR